MFAWAFRLSTRGSMVLPHNSRDTCESRPHKTTAPRTTSDGARIRDRPGDPISTAEGLKYYSFHKISLFLLAGLVGWRMTGWHLSCDQIPSAHINIIMIMTMMMMMMLRIVVKNPTASRPASDKNSISSSLLRAAFEMGQRGHAYL